jgi:predicted peptidase
MIRIYLFVIAWGFCLNCSAQNRSWESQDGRKIEATLQGWSPDSSQVALRRADGKVFALALSALSETDQKFVKQKIADQARLRGFKEGPYAEAFDGEWVKFPREKHGLIFQLYGTRQLARSKEPVPLFVHLHGASSRGSDVETGKVEIAAKRLAREEQYKKTPCVIMVPTCPENVFWGQQVKELEAIIDDLIRELPIDRDRIYLSGYSMGARGIGSLLESRPEFYAAAMFADGETKTEWAKTIDTSLWLWFSGERNLERAKATAAAFQEAGKQVHFEGFPEFTHNQIHWKLAHDEEVFPWMFSQVRGKK